MSKAKVKAENVVCLNGSVHHYQQISDPSITAHTLGQIGIPYSPTSNKPLRFICIQCGRVITV